MVQARHEFWKGRRVVNDHFTRVHLPRERYLRRIVGPALIRPLRVVRPRYFHEVKWRERCPPPALANWRTFDKGNGSLVGEDGKSGAHELHAHTSCSPYRG